MEEKKEKKLANEFYMAWIAININFMHHLPFMALFMALTLYGTQRKN